MDCWTTMTREGVKGNTYHTDDYDEAERLAVADGYTVLDAYQEDEGQWILVVAS